MNPKIVVDHELFTTCRLCLDEKGKYQIVPAIQENIKFVFDIEVELNNGLPQLICVECEKVLSNFVCTKQLFQEKQKRFQQNLLGGKGTVGRSSTNQENSREALSSNSNNEDSEAEQDRLVTNVISSSGKNTKLIIKKNKKSPNKSWRSSFVKQFGCRLCSEKFNKKDEIESHIKAHGRNISHTCFVRLEKYDDKPNITGSTKFVALNRSKIVRNKKNYYIVYLHKSNYHSDSSDNEVFAPRRKFKRQKLDSESSVDTLLIDESETNIKPEIKTDEMIRDTTQGSTSECYSQSLPKINDQSNVIDTLITECYKNFLKKMDSTYRNSKNVPDKSQLRHKVLSIGSKVINTNPINCIGLLRYLEHRNLEVHFKTNETNDNYVRIRTKLRCKKEKHKNKTNYWKSFQNSSISEPSSDFFDVLSVALNTETVAEHKTLKPINILSGILLNANPVSNPKKLVKKNDEPIMTIQKSSESENIVRGNVVIDTTNQNVSCATNGAKGILTADSSNTTQNALPRLKLKPVHELMAPESRGRNQDKHYSQPFHCYAAPARSNLSAGAAACPPSLFETSYNPIHNGRAVQKYMSIAPTHTFIRPLAQIGNTMSNGTGEANFIRKTEYVTLHTVEFPNTMTKSPFTYFKNLLQVNNIYLKDSKTILNGNYRCLIKFKLGVSMGHDDRTHVELCLSLFSDVNSFCIKVANSQGIDLDINQMSANWQWEILKSFTNQIVPRLVTNARNISLPMYEAVQKFVCYLKSIQVV